MSHWDAVVVGGGPAGSATALLLARAGARVLLTERARFPRDKACAEYLSPATTAILERLGRDVVAAIDQATPPPSRLSGMKLIGPHGTSAIGRFRRWSYALPRTTFDTILRDAAARAGAVIKEGAAVEDLIYDGGAVGGVVARETGNGKRETIHARVVIGADGLRSVVARRLGLRRSSAPHRIAFSVHLEGVAGMSDLGEMHIGRPGYVGLGPIGGDLATLALVLPVAVARRRARVLAAHLLPEMERFPGLAGRFANARIVRPVLTTGPFAQWSRRAVAPGGGALLVGDAADFFDPFTGQGIYAALRGAELAAESVLRALPSGGSRPLGASALAGYRAARRRAFAGKWLLERLIGLGVGWPWLAQRVVSRLARRPALADLLVGATGNIVPARAVLAPTSLLQLVW